MGVVFTVHTGSGSKTFGGLAARRILEVTCLLCLIGSVEFTALLCDILGLI